MPDLELPGEYPGLVDDLNNLFDQLILVGGEFKTPLLSISQFAMHHAIDPVMGLERVRVVDWVSEDTVDIFRPTLESPDKDVQTESVIEEEPGVIYKITARDLFARFYRSHMSDGTDTRIRSRNYEIFPDKIRSWGELLGDELVYVDVPQTDEDFDDTASDIKTMLHIDELYEQLSEADSPLSTD